MAKQKDEEMYNNTEEIEQVWLLSKQTHRKTYFKNGVAGQISGIIPDLPLTGVFIQCDFHPNLREEVASAISAAFIACEGHTGIPNMNPEEIVIEVASDGLNEFQFGTPTGAYRLRDTLEETLHSLTWSICCMNIQPARIVFKLPSLEDGWEVTSVLEMNADDWY